MFENATILRMPAVAAGTTDVSYILDAALYYGSTQLILDNWTTPKLIRRLGSKNFIRLLRDENFSITICLESPGVFHVQDYGPGYFTPRSFLIDPTRSKNRANDPSHLLQRLVNFNHPFPISIVESNRIIEAANIRLFNDLLGTENDTNRLFKSLVNDTSAMRDAVRMAARAKGAALNEPMLEAAKFRFLETPDGVRLDGYGVNLAEIVPDPGPQGFGWSDPLGILERYRTDLLVSETMDGDFILPEYYSEFSTTRTNSSLRRANMATENMSAFQDTVLKGKSLGAAYEAGAITFDEALGIISDARKFKEWAHKLPSESNLVTEYYDAVSKAGILDRFPGREIRLLAMTALGAAAGTLIAPGVGSVAGGAALGAFDTYVLGRLGKGWRPSNFVQNLNRKI